MVWVNPLVSLLSSFSSPPCYHVRKEDSFPLSCTIHFAIHEKGRKDRVQVGFLVRKYGILYTTGTRKCSRMGNAEVVTFISLGANHWVTLSRSRLSISEQGTIVASPCVVKNSLPEIVEHFTLQWIHNWVKNMFQNNFVKVISTENLIIPLFIWEKNSNTKFRFS